MLDHLLVGASVGQDQGFDLGWASRLPSDRHGIARLDRRSEFVLHMRWERHERTTFQQQPVDLTERVHQKAADDPSGDGRRIEEETGYLSAPGPVGFLGVGERRREDTEYDATDEPCL